MTDSWKIAVVSGLVAGFVSGIIFSIFAKIASDLGFWESWERQLWPYSLEVNILVGAIWGIILGIIYSKAYRIIPGKGIQKGVYFGLIIFLIHTVRLETFLVAYAYYLDVAAELLSFFFMWAAYGLVLGFFFEFIYGRYHHAEEEPKIMTYPMKSGLLPGVIAGFIGGIAAATTAVLGSISGFQAFWGAPTTPTMDFLINQFGTHVFINMVWGTILGMIFSKVYNLVPGKGVMKGLTYGLIVFLITTFQYHVWFGSMAAFHNAYKVVTSLAAGNTIGFFQFFFFGIVLGLLYRKPSE